MVGRSLHHYRILHALGAGGMGEVYAAEDTKLHRRIALKILPAAVASDPDRLHRFQREAQAIAALNHPNVVTVHSVEEDAGVHFLTMELVEGKALNDAIPEHGLPLDALLKIAVPLVDAVAAAHQRGIVHRDLKPANVMIGTGGRVKVLDFGLAKLKPELAVTSGLGGVTTGPTVTATAEPRVLGTAAYMSPEQAEGRAVDQRSDIFAIGVLLYEMATGVRPFQGDTALSVISSILKDPAPALSKHKTGLPERLDGIIRRCLAKDPDHRYQSALDLGHDLEDLGRQPVPVSRGRSRLLRDPRFAVSAAAGAALIVIAAAAWLWVAGIKWRSDASAPRATFSQVTAEPGSELFTSLSPDGRSVVYTGDTAGNRDIYLQSVTGSRAMNLTADSPTEDEEPAFSPDGERIVFRSGRDGGGLFVMGRMGESPTRLTAAGFNPAWSPDGTRVAFTTAKMELKPQNSDTSSDLFVVDVKGGEPRLLFQGASSPAWSPDGRRIAFTRRASPNTNMDLWTIPVTGGEPVPVTSDQPIDWNPVWAPDGKYLYFASDRGGSMNLWRVAIDQASGRTLGEPQAITAPAPFVAHLSISADGRRIAYSSVAITQNVYKLPFDPVRGTVGADTFNVTTGSRLWSSPDPSPDGQWVAFYSQSPPEPEGHMYVIRSDGTGLRQLTGDSFVDRVPRWSPDGNWIAWFSNRSKSYQIWKIHPDGSGLQQVTAAKGAGYFAWSPNGSRIVVTQPSGEGLTVFNPNVPWSGQQTEALPLPPGSRKLRVTTWSPDGGQLAGQLLPGFGIGTYDLRTKTVRTWANYGEWPTFLPDSRRIVFVSEGKVFVLDTVSGEVRKIYSVPRDVIGPPRLTRDGRAMFFTRRVNEADVWLASLQ